MKEKRNSGNLFSRLQDYMYERRKQRDRETFILLGGGCAIVLVIAVIMIIVGTIFSAVETANVQRTYGKTYARACQPIPAGSDSTANLPDAPPPLGILLMNAGTQQRHTWHSQLPEQWRAESETNVALVGCVDEAEVLLETCEYSRAADEGSFTVRVKREQIVMTLLLINPDTSRRVASQTVLGTEPEACPLDEDVVGSKTLQGDTPTWEAFAPFVETFVFGA